MTPSFRIAAGAAGVATAAMLALAAPGFSATAPENPQPIVINEGELELQTSAPAPEFLKDRFDRIYSGWLFRDPDTQAMQMDDFQNPMFIYVDQGIDSWNTAEGTQDKSCADCHNDIEAGMEGVRAAMPKMSEDGSTLWSLENFVNNCRTTRMGAEAWDWNSQDMRNLTSAISLQSRGMPVAVAIDGPAAEWWEKGKEIYYTRYGQLEQACANCHEDHYGDYIRADHLSQGQSNGFPLYRLKDANVVSLHNRFKGCIRDTRGVPFEIGGDEFRALELYVASRGLGLPVEGVGVRH